MHHKMPVLGFRMGNFTYITDANYIETTELNKIKGSSVLVLNALRKEKHLSHFTLQEALDIATISAVPEVYFTHISHQLGLHDTINAELPAHVKLAYDGLVVRL
jgi:phosphoribosyl 1,2-cyclic phosphate phosphodiesterase